MKKLLYILLLILCYVSHTTAQELSMFPGYFGNQFFQDTDRITKVEAEELLKTNEISCNLWSKQKQHFRISTTTLVTGVGLVMLGNVTRYEAKFSPILRMAGITSLAVSVGFVISSNKLKAKSILAYNKSFDVSSIHIGTTPTGVGILCSF